MGAPVFVNFIVVVGLSFVLCYLLKLLKKISENWKLQMKARITKALELRKQIKDPFRNTYGYSWDYIMVFKILPVRNRMSEKQQNKSMKYVINRLADAGLQNKLFYSVQRDELYCKIRCSLPRLQREADRINYLLPLEPTRLCLALRAGKQTGPIEKHWTGIDLDSTHVETEIDPFDYIYCDYRMSEDSTMYKTWPNNSIFRGVDRLKLIQSILTARLSDGGAFLDVYRLMKENCLLTIFPLHDAVELTDLQEKWLRMCQMPWRQNVDAVKNYFGEKIGLFFLFLGHYTTCSVSAAIAGLLVSIVVAGSNNNPNSSIIPFFAAFISIWSTTFLEYWKRTEKFHAMKWGMVGYEDTQQDRPEFDGEPSFNPVDGGRYLYFPLKTFFYRQFVSMSIVGTLIFIVLGVIVGLFVIRVVLSHNSALIIGGVALGPIVAGIIMAVQIQILNALYQDVAVKLNDYENHRTDTQYEDALIGKTFVFQFVNSFANMYYIAFVKPYIADIDPCVASCLVDLQAAIGTIFLTRLATGSILKLLLPYINKIMNEAKESQGVDKDLLTEVELAFIQEQYHVLLGPFTDYASLSIQFAYATMFIVAYPLAMVMSLVSNYIEIRVDAWKLTQQCRRPEPRSCEDIGSWYYILEVISFSAVVTNSALVSFTGEFLINYTYPVRIWVFLGMMAGLLLLKYVVAEYVPDSPREVEIQLERQEYFRKKILLNIPDEDDTALLENIKSKINYTIRINDDDPL